MSVACRVAALASTALVATPALCADAFVHDPAIANPQYVLISFDGAHDIAQWQRSRTLAAVTGARFTYFLSCVYLLSPQHKTDYRAPGKGAGKSNVGFASSKEDVARRLQQIRFAASEEHEIASHACGHFDGSNWTKADWLKEFASFKRILGDAYEINGIDGEPSNWKAFAASAVKGFRAPYLATGNGLYKALEEAGYRFDASGVSSGPALPGEDAGVARFSLPQIAEGPSSRRVIAMDYNLFVRHSGGFERPDEAAAFQERSYEAFKAAFDAQYSGKRVPLQLGFHFTLMNDGAYWRALERFARDVCVRPDVICTTYSDYLDRTGAPAQAAPEAAGG